MKKYRLTFEAKAFSTIILIGGVALIGVFAKKLPTYATPTAYEEEMAAETISSETETEQIYFKAHKTAETETITEKVTEYTTEEETTTTEAETEPEWVPYSFCSLPDDFQYQVKVLCDKYEIAYDLVLSWMWVESRWDTNAVSPNGAVGLMQIIPYWHEAGASAMGLNIYEPIQNVEYALVLLTQYMAQSNGSLDAALSAYNGDTTGSWYCNLVYEAYEKLLRGEIR